MGQTCKPSAPPLRSVPYGWYRRAGQRSPACVWRRAVVIRRHPVPHTSYRADGFSFAGAVIRHNHAPGRGAVNIIPKKRVPAAGPRRQSAASEPGAGVCRQHSLERCTIQKTVANSSWGGPALGSIRRGASIAPSQVRYGPARSNSTGSRPCRISSESSLSWTAGSLGTLSGVMPLRMASRYDLNFAAFF